MKSPKHLLGMVVVALSCYGCMMSILHVSAQPFTGCGYSAGYGYGYGNCTTVIYQGGAIPGTSTSVSTTSSSSSSGSSSSSSSSSTGSSAGGTSGGSTSSGKSSIVLTLSDRKQNNTGSSSSTPETISQALANKGLGASDPKRLPKTGVAH